MNELVSIIIPFYNSEKYLKRSLDSVVFQSYKNLDIILIDDKSTDDSLSICKTYQKNDGRIRIFKNDINKGPGGSRNLGLKNAMGEYVYFMDSDDELDKNAILLLLDSYKKHDMDLAIGNVKRIDLFANVSQDWSGDSKLFKSREEIVELVAGFLNDIKSYRLFGSAWGKLYKMDIIKNNGLIFDEDVYAWEDILFVMEYLQHVNSLYFIKKHLYTYYHFNQDNHGSVNTFKGFFDFKKTIKIAKKIIDSDSKRDKKENNKLFANGFSEASLMSIFNCCYRINSFSLLWDTIKQMLNDEELKKNIYYYEQKHNDNFRIIPFLIKHKMSLLIIILFKIQILKMKIFQKIAKIKSKLFKLGFDLNFRVIKRKIL